MQTTEAGDRESKRAVMRRGRIPHATYVRVVGQMLVRDWFALESCEMLTQLELVGRLVEAYPDHYPSRGWAVRALLDKAIDDVLALCGSRPDAANMRLVRFLEARRAGKSVTAIALEWGLSRECVSRKVGHQAVLLVTDRLLARNRRGLSAREPVAMPSNSRVRSVQEPRTQHSA
jgi:hypothetical protein